LRVGRHLLSLRGHARGIASRPAGEFEAGAANPQKVAGPDRHYFLRSARYDTATGFTPGDVSMKTLKTLAIIGLLAILVGIASAVYFFGGYYNVAGTAEEPAIVKWALVKVRQASVAQHAKDRPPTTLDDPATVQAGARAFSERGCVNCHGGPGVNWAKFSEGLRPDPPDLKELADKIPPEQLFWVIKHGINMTGMPSFGLIEVPDQEIWTIVAFVKKLPSVSDADFKAWTTKP
jgi:mono/diheme cytochrome c family protein